MYKFGVLAMDNDGLVVNFTLHESDEDYENEFSQMMDGGLFNGRTA